MGWSTCPNAPLHLCLQVISFCIYSHVSIYITFLCRLTCILAYLFPCLLLSFLFCLLCQATTTRSQVCLSMVEDLVPSGQHLSWANRSLLWLALGRSSPSPTWALWYLPKPREIRLIQRFNIHSFQIKFQYELWIFLVFYSDKCSRFPENPNWWKVTLSCNRWKADPLSNWMLHLPFSWECQFTN